MEALSAEIKSLLTGPLKGKRTGVGELRKKMEAQSDAQVSSEAVELTCGALRFGSVCCRRLSSHENAVLTFTTPHLPLFGICPTTKRPLPWSQSCLRMKQVWCKQENKDPQKILYNHVKNKPAVNSPEQNPEF